MTLSSFIVVCSLLVVFLHRVACQPLQGKFWCILEQVALLSQRDRAAGCVSGRNITVSALAPSVIAEYRAVCTRYRAETYH